jgi:hypothetical protein
LRVARWHAKTSAEDDVKTSFHRIKGSSIAVQMDILGAGRLHALKEEHS